MSLDDEDLERAGTRSRRQLTNSKKYSVYPPPLEQDVDQQDITTIDGQNHPLRKPNTYLSNLVKSRSRAFTLICCILIILFVGFYRYPSIHLPSRKDTKTLFEEKIEFNDSSQYTDYALLDRLLIDKKATPVATSASRFDNYFNVNYPGENSFVNLLSKGSVIGHTFDELRRLTNSVSLPVVSTGKSRRVPVTAIVHMTTVTQLYIQVQAILTQTALPEHIWIICDTASKQEVEARIMTLDRRRVKVMARDDETSLWLQTAAHVATEFVWIIDQDIAPGKRYLENLLKLSFTSQYKSALLGTEGAVFNMASKDKIECIPDTMHSGSRQMRSQAVDMINDSWLLHRSWIPYLMEAMEKEEATVAEPLMGLFISRTLYMTAGIPSIALPSDPIERAYWGDVRLQRTQRSETCKALEATVNDKEMQPKIYQDMLYRGQPPSSPDIIAKPILFYVDSSQDFQHLAPLICRFEAKEEIDLHIVTSGNLRGLSDQQIKSSLPSLCGYSDFPSRVIVHDISILRASTDWNLVNDVLHRLTRILTVVRPVVMIHTLQNDVSISMDAVSKIVHVPSIYLPAQDITHVTWMTELSLDTLSKWNAFNIKVMITTDKKPHALARLLNSATNAHYLGDKVDLTILMDQTSDQVTQTLANNYNWKKGVKSVRHRIATTPKSPIFVESWYPVNNDEYAIILNNDIELSPMFYVWAKYAILQYRYESFSDQLFGISLYSPQILETDPSGRRLFNASQTIQGDAYLMQLPSHSGAVYFPEHWREFHDYITARMADINGFEMQEVTVPNLRSSEWERSWRKYFEELIYLRSYVMLYPTHSLSTVHLELKKKALREQFKDAISLYTVPLYKQDFDMTLPPLNQLSLFDLWGSPASMDELKERGLTLRAEISSCSLIDQQYDPTDLLCPFGRLVSVSVENENDLLPELPTKEITVYT
ncbi:hypothetical protein HMPREF1544_02553 [Mucor circinelloides 1006PhL]|uniref:Glycosyltransferase 2-like domain-containing protein n=1 Tax=Mucor circinelloides f. circinelloides (strain 1006PhL) TaxID=1220926 RepID=S2K5H4_MUCC1|nr:hypothetical protein HMPREF1544_02553 [Mucor circinelloides 1006PhL]KAG1118222.1 hypothetical protein G6F42_013249 [Rhizopus arrhizus]